MNAVRAIWTNGRILPSEPVDWPEGSKLLVEPLSTEETIGLDESEWTDDAAALADWEAWIHSIEPLDLTEEEERDMERYQEEFRRFNLDAVRRQMETGEF